ncbi:MAG: hypothetical protein K2K42_03625, partial [Eubacterium sp.]|nr:hypothetical protein [Eubacterium sp.]
MNNELLSTLAKSIFALADNETVSRAFNILQVTMNKEYIVDELEYYGYTELATAVKNFNGKLSEIPWFTTVKDEEGNDVKVPSAQFGQKWYVDAAEGDDENADFKAKVYETWKKNWLDKHKGQTFKETELDVVYRFSRALMVVLAPFSKLIEVLTTANVVQFGDADANISIQGSYGYTSAIKPLLDALGCDTVSVEKYRADAADDSNLAILNVIRPLIARVDTIMQIPTRGVLGTLARLANFINVGGIQKAIENLLRPLTVLLNPVIDLINDDFEGDQTGNLYDVIFNIVDTALLDRNSDGVGALTDNGITWDNFHADITKLLNAVIPTLYVTRYKDPVTNEERLYKATKTTTKNILGKPTDRYEIDVQAVDEDGNPIKDAQNNDVYNKERIAASNITTVPNGIIINDVAYPITIPENINGFLAKLAGCAGETDVDMDASGSLLPKDYLDNKAAYNSFQEYKQNNVYAKVAVTLLRFVWDAVQANVTDLIDPLLTNLVDGKLDLSKDGIDKAYTDFIRTYIMNDDNSIIDELLGKAKVTLNYDGSEFVDLVIGLINALDASDHKVTDWDDIITGDYTAGTVTYPTAPGATTPYTSNDVKNLVNVISNIAMAAVEAFLDLSTVGLADDNIYSSQFVVNIAKAVYPLFDSAAIQSVLQILGVERVNLEYLANRLDREGYDRTAE